MQTGPTRASFTQWQQMDGANDFFSFSTLRITDLHVFTNG
jgi:hypothetical protein